MNASGFQTWRALHATYDQGQDAQQLQALHGIMKKCNMEQCLFVRLFNQWWDEIINYEESTSTILNDAIKTSMLLHRLLKEK
eukprot:5106785-Amphidinium_carterae.1